MTRVRIESTAGERLRGLALPVEVRTPSLAVVAETSTGGELDLLPGRYIVVARLPSGAAITRVVAIEGDRQTVLLEVEDSEPLASSASPRARQAMVRAATQDLVRPAAVVSRRQVRELIQRMPSLTLSPELAGSGAGRLLASVLTVLGRAVEGMHSLLGRAKPDIGEQSAEAAAPSAHLRFFVARPLELRAEPIEVRPELVELAGRRAVLRVPPGTEVRCAQVLHPGRPAVNLALPTSAAAGCLLVVHREPARYWLEVQLEHPLTDLLLGYRRNHAAQEETSTAERLLGSAAEDPVATALAAWSLLRFGALEALGDVPARLRHDVPWLPDGPALHGEWLARQGEHRPALEAFLEVRERGLPLFSDGLVALHARLDLYARSERELDARQLDPVRQLLTLLRPFVAFLDVNQPVTTFTGLDPARPDDAPMADPLPADLGGMELGKLFERAGSEPAAEP